MNKSINKHATDIQRNKKTQHCTAPRHVLLNVHPLIKFEVVIWQREAEASHMTLRWLLLMEEGQNENPRALPRLWSARSTASGMWSTSIRGLIRTLQTGAASPSSRCARMPFICVSAAEQWHRGGWGDLISASMMSSYATSLTTVCLCCPEGPTNVTSVTPVTSLLVHTLTFLCDDFWKGKMVTCVLCEGICTR